MSSEHQSGGGRSRRRSGRRQSGSNQSPSYVPRRPGSLLVGGLMLATFVFAGITFALLGSLVPQFGAIEPTSASGTNSSSSGGTPVLESTATPKPEPTATQTATSEPSPTSAWKPAFVVRTGDGQGINLRAQPGTNGAILAALPTGTEVKIIGEDQTADGYTWRNVETEKGQQGWVVADFLASP